MGRSFSFVLVGKHSPEALHEALKELASASDRAAAIVGGTLVETALTNALKMHLHQEDKILERLFNTSGALGAFATKVDLGFLTGLYGKKGHRELITIKDIRNAFAHRLEASTFKNQQISDWCMNLKLCERYAVDLHNYKRDPESRIGAGVPHKDWPHWIFVDQLDDALKDPRERFLITMEMLMWIFSVVQKTRMPVPVF